MTNRWNTRVISAFLLVPFASAVPGAAEAQKSESKTEGGGVLEEAGISPSVLTGSLYGFIEARFEKAADSPVKPGADGKPETEENAHEFDVPALHVMVQALVADRFRFFLNLAALGAGDPTSDEGVVVRNAWIELPIYQSFFNMRIGKTYRRFGIYNEQLDATPSFPGIEPPELFDGDHLMLTRTTNFMLHGTIPVSDNSISYAIMTGNDERSADQVPLGLDVHVDIASTLRVGSSFYTSNGDAVPTRAVGDGAPNGGVVNWMASDSYYVVGGYGQLTWGPVLFQAEYWQARHNAKRDPASVIALLGSENINPSQKARFGIAGAMPMESDVIVPVEYRVETFYARGAYELALTEAADQSELPWTLTPYLQFDYYKNPETIKDKDFGGDNEAGISDDGRFIKLTIGSILRPLPQVAIKLDGSIHFQKVGGTETNYPELRLSFSYYWELAG